MAQKPYYNHVVTGYPILPSYQPPQSVSNSPFIARKCNGEPLTARDIAEVSVPVFIVTIFILWCILGLAIGSPSSPEFRVNNATISNFSVSSFELISNWEFNLHVQNPNNKFALNYERINGSVLYKEKLVTQKLLPPFYQKKKTNNNITLSFSMDSSVYLDEAIGREIVWERNNNVLGFNLRMSILERHKYLFWKERKEVSVLCEDIKFKFSSNTSSTTSQGIMLGGTNQCQVKPKYL